MGRAAARHVHEARIPVRSFGRTPMIPDPSAELHSSLQQRSKLQVVESRLGRESTLPGRAVGHASKKTPGYLRAQRVNGHRQRVRRAGSRAGSRAAARETRRCRSLCPGQARADRRPGGRGPGGGGAVLPRPRAHGPVHGGRGRGARDRAAQRAAVRQPGEGGMTWGAVARSARLRSGDGLGWQI
jgi:hypothetical protein